MPTPPLLKTALHACDAAEAVILRYYQSDLLNIKMKNDSTPVTVADIQTELAIKSVIAKAFPTHGFYGEEGGQSNMNAEFIWLIDPIDGTKAFIRGRPFFSTQIALLQRALPSNQLVRDQFILGVSHAPVYQGGQRAHAYRGIGAFLNNQQIKISQTQTLDQTVLSSGNIKTLTQDAALWARYGQLLGSIDTIRGFGDFLHYHLLAAGKIDAVLESNVSILDVAALSVIVEEAGGIVSDMHAQPLTLASTSILASNPTLHPQIHRCLAGSV